MHVDEIYIVEGNRARVSKSYGCRVLGCCTNGIRAKRDNGWRIIGAGDGHFDDLSHRATCPIRDRDTIVLNELLSSSKIVQSTIVHIEGPTDRRRDVVKRSKRKRTDIGRRN